MTGIRIIGIQRIGLKTSFQPIYYDAAFVDGLVSRLSKREREDLYRCVANAIDCDLAITYSWESKENRFQYY